MLLSCSRPARALLVITSEFANLTLSQVLSSGSVFHVNVGGLSRIIGTFRETRHILIAFLNETPYRRPPSFCGGLRHSRLSLVVDRTLRFGSVRWFFWPLLFGSGACSVRRKVRFGRFLTCSVRRFTEPHPNKNRTKFDPPRPPPTRPKSSNPRHHTKK